MAKYALQRLFLMIPTLIGITMITYMVARLAPGDPVQATMGMEGMKVGGSSREAINQMRVLYGLSSVRPIRVFTDSKLPVENYSPDDLRQGFKDGKLKGFIAEDLGVEFQRNLIADLGLASTPPALKSVPDPVASLRQNQGSVGFGLDIPSGLKEIPLLNNSGLVVEATKEAASRGDYRLRHYAPKGLLQGYVEWLGGLFQGDLGYSTRDQQPVADKIVSALQPTLILSFLSILIAYLIAIPIGVQAAVKQNSMFDRSSTVVLFVLYSLPSFWVALLGIFFFGGGDYWDVFPIRGLGGEATELPTELARRLTVGFAMVMPLPVAMGVLTDQKNRFIAVGACTLLALSCLHFLVGMPGASVTGVLLYAVVCAGLSVLPQGFFRIAGAGLCGIAVMSSLFGVEGEVVTGGMVPWLDRAWHLFLPVTCLTYASFASLSRFQRTSLLEVIRQDYVRTARAKGLSERVIIWKHAVRNSLIPIVTLLGSTLPYLVGGAVIIEIIFTIPGMGRVGFEAILNRDYAVVMSVALMSACLTLVGILISDLTYAFVDPRISYDD